MPLEKKEKLIEVTILDVKNVSTICKRGLCILNYLRKLSLRFEWFVPFGTVCYIPDCGKQKLTKNDRMPSFVSGLKVEKKNEKKKELKDPVMFCCHPARGN